MLPQWFIDQWDEERSEARKFRAVIDDRLSEIENYIVADKATNQALEKREKFWLAAMGIVIAAAGVAAPFVLQ